MSEILQTGKVNLVILCGVPASGKSTFAKEFCEKNGVVHVSTDGIRAEIGSGEGDQTVSGAAFVIARKRIMQSLAAGKNALIDATNVNPKARKDWIKIGREANAFITAVAFEVSKDEVYKRNEQRERKVFTEIIDSFINRYERPRVPDVDKVVVLGSAN
jgi:protein phosphatase